MSAEGDGRRSLYPALEPHTQGMLEVDATVGHKLSYAVYGSDSADAPAAVFLHGGPGAGASPASARFFNPKFKAVVFDQRGSGKSEPNGEMRNNTTWDLVEDIEKLRVHLGIEKWAVVFGGSWGSTLALTYAIKHPDRTGSLVLRGIFLFDPDGMRWLFQEGASEMYPDAWESYAGHIPAGERGDLLGAYHRRVMSSDRSVSIPAAREFVRWELSISKLEMNVDAIEGLLEDERFILPFARAETAYFVHGGWFPGEEEEGGDGEGGEGGDGGGEGGGEEGVAAVPFVRRLDRPKHLAPAGPGGWDSALPWILRHSDAIRDIPTAIVHGRQDIVCRPRAAWELHKRLPKSTLRFIHDAGHSDSEPGTASALVDATDSMLKLVAGIDAE